jgi:hypothetical protein
MRTRAFFHRTTSANQEHYDKFDRLCTILGATTPIIPGEIITRYYSTSLRSMESVGSHSINFTELTSALWLDVTGRSCYGNPIYVDSDQVKYSEESQLPNTIVRCEYCGKIHDVQSTVCPHCGGVSDLGAHQTPPNGWLPQTVNSSDQSPLFGFEIEMEFPEMSHPFDTVRKAIRETGIAIPGFLERDSSLRNGAELVTHPMSYDYIVKHNDDFKRLILKLIELGANKMSYRGAESAGLHVHINRPCRQEQITDDQWYEESYSLRTKMSGRIEEKMNACCGGRNGRSGYNYIGNRNKENTWEFRGAGFGFLMQHPDGLPHMAAWAQCMGNMWSNEGYRRELRYKSFYDILTKFEFTESAEWWYQIIGDSFKQPVLDQVKLELEDKYKKMVENWAKNLTCRELIKRPIFGFNAEHDLFVGSITDFECFSGRIVGLNSYEPTQLHIQTTECHRASRADCRKLMPKYMSPEDHAMLPPVSFEEYYTQQIAEMNNNPLYIPNHNDTIVSEVA